MGFYIKSSALKSWSLTATVRLFISLEIINHVAVNIKLAQSSNDSITDLHHKSVLCVSDAI